MHGKPPQKAAAAVAALHGPAAGGGARLVDVWLAEVVLGFSDASRERAYQLAKARQLLFTVGSCRGWGTALCCCPGLCILRGPLSNQAMIGVISSRARCVPRAAAASRVLPCRRLALLLAVHSSCGNGRLPPSRTPLPCRTCGWCPSSSCACCCPTGCCSTIRSTTTRWRSASLQQTWFTWQPA
jgi:hypothetical protein